MSFARGKYGVEYTRRPAEEETHGIRRLVISIVVISIVVSIVAHFLMKGKDPTREATDPTDPEHTLERTSTTPLDSTAQAGEMQAGAPLASPPQQPDALATQNAKRMLEKIRQRPATERVLLEKLAAAERQGDMVVAVDTIERLCNRPAVADLHPQLRERLGMLNMKLLFSGRSSPWTARVTVKRGDSRDRIARDHRTTGTALERLNPNTNWTRIRPGDVVQVLEYPRGVLVIHKALGFADLSLKGKFFRRYYFKNGTKATVGVYPVSREQGKGVRAHLKTLGIVFALEDRADLEMFLAPESSSITVSEE